MKVTPKAHRHKLGRVLIGAAVLVWTSLTMAPVVAVFWGAISQSDAVVRGQFSAPSSFTLDSVRRAWRGPQFGQPLWHSSLNSACAVAIAIAVVMVIGAPTAFFISQRREGFGARLGGYFWILLAVPALLTWVPLFALADKFGLLSKPWALGLIYAGGSLPVVVALLRSTYSGFPREILEAARIDGASDWRILMRIAVPITRRQLVAVALLQIVVLWQELALASVILQRGTTRTVPVDVALFRGQYGVDLGAQSAALALGLVPMLALYALTQRRFLQDLRLMSTGTQRTK